MGAQKAEMSSSQMVTERIHKCIRTQQQLTDQQSGVRALKATSNVDSKSVGV